MVVPEGTYHIVSNYGDSNAVVRSDIRVQAGKLTDVTVTHRAAVITLKLVSERGGEALANTNWSVLTPGGDVIKESIGAFPRSVILAEGDYRAIARNEGRPSSATSRSSPASTARSRCWRGSDGAAAAAPSFRDAAKAANPESMTTSGNGTEAIGIVDSGLASGRSRPESTPPAAIAI